MDLVVEPYVEQIRKWPSEGRHLLAQHTDRSVVAYQAYRPSIGQYAATHGRFGGEFSFSRMSWIKPSFLWMMSRSGWATKKGQEVVLAVHLHRSAFDEILRTAVPATASTTGIEPGEEPEGPAVTFQWDPDHDPWGAPLDRRTIQIGLRGEALSRYSREWVDRFEDITGFVREQRGALESDVSHLLTPVETLYPIRDPRLAGKLGLSSS